jgi:hypothetical protein
MTPYNASSLDNYLNSQRARGNRTKKSKSNKLPNAPFVLILEED